MSETAVPPRPPSPSPDRSTLVPGDVRPQQAKSQAARDVPSPSLAPCTPCSSDQKWRPAARPRGRSASRGRPQTASCRAGHPGHLGDLVLQALSPAPSPRSTERVPSPRSVSVGHLCGRRASGHAEECADRTERSGRWTARPLARTPRLLAELQVHTAAGESRGAWREGVHTCICVCMCVCMCVQRGLERAGQARRGLALMASAGLARPSEPSRHRHGRVLPCFVSVFGSFQSGWKSWFLSTFSLFCVSTRKWQECDSSRPPACPPRSPIGR